MEQILHKNKCRRYRISAVFGIFLEISREMYFLKHYPQNTLIQDIRNEHIYIFVNELALLEGTSILYRMLISYKLKIK